MKEESVDKNAQNRDEWKKLGKFFARSHTETKHSKGVK